MNLVDCYVTQILEESYYKYNNWWQNVQYESYGGLYYASIMKKEKEDIDKIKVGYKFQS